jgi:hypothetical protein
VKPQSQKLGKYLWYARLFQKTELIVLFILQKAFVAKNALEL